MTDAALFDWDGTLLDSREALLGAWHAATSEVLGRRWPVTDEEHDLVYTIGGRSLFPRIAGDDAPALGAAFQRAYASTTSAIRAFDGVVDAVGELRAAGVAIGVVTSKSRVRYDADAEAIGVAGLVDVAVCSEDTERHKPDPDPVLLALERLAVAPQDAVMAGDTPVDVAAGRAAGTRVVGVGWGYFGTARLRQAGATEVAEDPAELVRLVLEPERATERTAT
jgi:pyrophosphatase PpaX